MTLAALVRTVEYAGQALPATCPVPFQFFGASELAVVLRSAAGVETPAVGYTVTGGNGGTGSVVFAGSTLGATIVIRGRTRIDQQLDLPEGGAFPSDAIEKAFDRAAAIDQETRDQVGDVAGRALLLPRGETAGVLPAASARAGRVAGFDVLGRWALLTGTSLLPMILPLLPAAFKGDPGRDGASLPGLTPDAFGGKADLITSGGINGAIVGNPTDNLAAIKAAMLSSVYFAENDLYRQGAPLQLGVGGRYLSDTLEVRITQRIKGSGGGQDNNNGSILRLPPNKTGILLAARFSQNGGYSPIDHGDHSSGTVLDSLYLVGSGTNPNAHGVKAMEVGIVQYVTAEGFGGNGFEFGGNNNFMTPGDPQYGNVNGMFVMRCLARGNQGFGFRLFGIDGNCQTHIGNQVKSGSGAGIVDTASYANVHINFEVDSSGGNNLGRCNHNGRNYTLLAVSAATARAIEPGTNWQVWLDQGAQAAPSPFWPAWSNTRDFMIGLGFVGEGGSNNGAIIGGYGEAFPGSGTANIANSRMIAIGGDIGYTKNSGHIYKEGPASGDLILSRVGIGGVRDHYQQQNYIAAFGNRSMAVVGASPGGNYVDFYMSNEMDGASNLSYVGNGQAAWSRGFPGQGNPFVFTISNQRTSRTYGRAAPQVDVMMVQKLAVGHVGQSEDAARIVQYASELPATGQQTARGDIFFNTEATPGARAGWITTTGGVSGSTAVIKPFAPIDA